MPMENKPSFAAANTPAPFVPEGAHGLSHGACRILRAEGLACLVLACALYQAQGYSWRSFGLWFFLPDVALLVYLLGRPVAGMWAYNLTHSTMGAGIVVLVGLYTGAPAWLQAGLIWFAHIGFDRALGYGLKSRYGFRFTHLSVLRTGRVRHGA